MCKVAGWTTHLSPAADWRSSVLVVQVVSVFETAGWPIRAFVMKCRDGVNRQALADVAGTLVCVLLELDIPHNVLIGEAGAELYVFPRQPQAPCGNGTWAMWCVWRQLAWPRP